MSCRFLPFFAVSWMAVYRFLPFFAVFDLPFFAVFCRFLPFRG